MPEDDTTLDHRTRRMIFNYISSHPGEPFQRISRVLDINASTLRYHLNFLEKNSKVIIRKENGKNCCYPANIVSEPEDLDHKGLTRVQMRVLDVIKNDPGITLKEISDVSNLEKKAVVKCIRALRDKRLIWKVRSGRVSGYEYITNEKLKVEMLKLLIDRFLHNEIDKDLFLALKKELEKD